MHDVAPGGSCFDHGVVARLGKVLVKRWSRTDGVVESETLVLVLPDGRSFAKVGVQAEMNSQSMNASESRVAFEMRVDGSTLVVTGAKTAGGGDERAIETLTVCGLLQGMPHCSRGIDTRDETTHETMDGSERRTGYRLTASVKGDRVTLTRRSGTVPPTMRPLLGTHPLPW